MNLSVISEYAYNEEEIFLLVLAAEIATSKLNVEQRGTEVYR